MTLQRRWSVPLLTTALLTLSACSSLTGEDSLPPAQRETTPGPEDTVRVAAAGDIACGPRNPYMIVSNPQFCQSEATARLVEAGDYDAVLPLGDLQYPNGSLTRFIASYGRSWGRFKDITRPILGNHEYDDPDAEGFYSYFCCTFGPERDKGFYAFDLGSWRFLALNSERGYEAGGAQLAWLERQLASSPQCTLAYMHRARFSSGQHYDQDDVDPFWDVLLAAGVDVVLASHDHSYERFKPLDEDGNINPRKGMLSFVVGTGGASHYRVKAEEVSDRTAAVNDDTFGILSLSLAPGQYSYEFIPVPGATFRDSGQGRCQ